MPQPLRVFINSPIAPEITWAWSLFARDFGLSWLAAASPEEVQGGGGIAISEEPGADIPLSAVFRKQFQSGVYRHEEVMPSEPLIRCADGREDYLSSVFYLVNSLQEYNHPARDEYGRFPYRASLQARFECAEENLTGEYFTALYRQLSSRCRLPEFHPRPSRIFLSHDIDRVYHAWKDDGKQELLNGRPDRFAGLLWRQLTGRPDWLNTQALLALDQSFSMPAVFFWIPRKARRGEMPPDADYRLNDRLVAEAMREIEQSPGYDLGMHASVNGELAAERKAFPFPVAINRQHFLRLRLPEHYDQVEAAGFSADASLGFSEHPGFRNSYSLPFQPWSVLRRAPHAFTEIPLHLMDASFHYHFPAPVQSSPSPIKQRASFAREHGEQFLTRHATGSVLSLLWHNNFLTSGAFGPYRPVLGAWLNTCLRLGLKGISLQELLVQYGPQEPARS